MDKFLCPVEVKIPALLICEHRPLKHGEKPKRKGQKTIFEATGAVNEGFLSLWNDKTVPRIVTIKHDGMCCKILKTEDGGIKLYRRYDVRKGNIPPTNSIPAGVSEKGEVEFYWVDITESEDPAEQYFMAALTKENKKIISFSIICPTIDGWECKEIPVSEIESGTYELVGPKVQANRYQFPLSTTKEVITSKQGTTKTVSLPKHYFIRHGSFDIDTTFNNDVKNLSVGELHTFIMKYSLEGLVFHFGSSKSIMYKVNRGHIGEELKGDEVLKLCITQIN